MHRSCVLSALPLVALVVAAGCGGATRTVTATPAATAPTTTQLKEREREYPADVQRNIVAGCTHGATESQCKCVLKKLEAHYTLAQLKAIEQGIEMKVAPPARFTKIAAECKR